MNPLIAYLQGLNVPPAVPAAMLLKGLGVSQPTLSRVAAATALVRGG